MIGTPQDDKHYHNHQKIIVMVSAVIFIISLTQTAFVTDKDDGNYPAILGLLTGWLGLYDAGIVWLANPLLIASWVFLLCRRSRLAMVLSLLAVMFCLLFLGFDTIIADEGGINRSTIISYGYGYWLWLLSCCISFSGCLTVFAKIRKRYSPQLK